MKFKIGDKVRLSNISDYYGICPDNPMNTVGTIIDFYDKNKAENGWHDVHCYMLSHDEVVAIALNRTHCICVAWSNGGHNCYRPSDLEIYKQYETAIASVL